MADIFNRVIGVIRGALVANIVAIVGAMLAVAKPGWRLMTGTRLAR